MMNEDPTMTDFMAANSQSAEEDRRKILESYEKAGVDLPLVTLETILDREIAEVDERQSGAPRFRNFLNKNRTFEEDGPDDELDELAAPPPPPPSYTANTPAVMPRGEPEILRAPDPVTPDTSTEIPQTPDVSTDIPPTPDRYNIDCSDLAEGAVLVLPNAKALKKDAAATFEQVKADCDSGFHSALDYCCAKTPESSPTKKLPASKLALPEGYDDEVQMDGDVPALMDNEESIVEEMSYKIEESPSVSKEESGGILGYFRGSRRFRVAVGMCCLLNIILIALIIAFVAGRNKNSLDTNSNAASVPETTAPVEPEVVVTETVAPVVETAAPTEAPIPTEPPCVDSLEVETTCFDDNNELNVSFNICTAEVGDWIAILEADADPEAITEADAVGWMFSCGDRFCEEAVANETLSFDRAKPKAESGGSYRAYLMREGEGPLFSAITMSPEFSILNRGASC